MVGSRPGREVTRGLPIAGMMLVLAFGRAAVGQETPGRSGTTAERSGGTSAREAQLEARVRQLEALLQKMPDPEEVRRLEARLRTLPDPAHVRQLETQVRDLSTQVRQLSRQLADPRARGAAAARANPAPAGSSAAAASGTSGGDAAGAGGDEAEENERVGGAAGTSPAAPPPTPRFDMPEPRVDRPLVARFGRGFELKTADDEYSFQFHDLTQLDGRFYQQSHQSPVTDTFVIPRQWFIFSGRLTKPVEYYLSIAEAFDTLNILDVFLNVNFDKRLQFRVGRFKSPFTYEFYAEAVQGLPNGEWSLFFNNFGMNRDLGAMVWGQAFQDRVDYAAGIFNSTPNSFLDLSNRKSFIGFLNVAPFETRQGSPLENFNIGGSVVAGSQDHVPVPETLRTIVPTSGNTIVGVPFLSFNNNVLTSGQRVVWSLHLAYYYRQLSLIGEWQSGFQDYAIANQVGRTHLPVESFYIQAAYLLTGERVATRGMVQPRRPFSLRPGKFGIGAWELAARYNLLTLGSQVFTAGLADPNLWTDRLYTTDLGVSWYWNPYVRILFDWQHAGFGSPVLYRPGGLQKTSNLYFIRFQLWF